MLGVLVGLATACAPSTEIYVDVHTDLVPGEEVDRVVVRVDDGSSRSARVGAGEPFLETARRFGPITTSAGRHRITVDLEHGGSVVLTRSITGAFEGTLVLTFWLTRACVGVTCPTASDPLATECDDGECVRPDCALTPGGCTATSCTLDAECTLGGPTCAMNACIGGRCALVPDDARCAATEYCDPDVGCAPRTIMGTDAGTPHDAGTPPDAGSDAGPPDAGPPPGRILRLADGAGSWSEITTTGAGPTERVLAAFSSTAAGEIIALTANELFALRVADHAWIARTSRSSVFPEIDAEVLFEAETVAALAPRLLFIYVSSGAYQYDWDAATRTATLSLYTARADFPAAEWGTPLAAPYWEVNGVFSRPTDTGAWITPALADACGAGSVGPHTTYISWDGFGPAAMMVSTYDYACARFVDKEIFGSFPPFSLPGTPVDPWSIEAAAWQSGGLYLFLE